MKTDTSTQDGAKRSNPSASQGAKLSPPQDIAGTKDKPGAKAKKPGNPNGGNGNGNGLRTGNASREAQAAAAVAMSVPRTRTQRRMSAVYASAAAAVAAASATPVRYGDGTRFDEGARYFVADPVTPIAGTAKVKLLLNTRNPPELAAFSESIVQAMTDNPWFVEPTPSDLVLNGKLTEFEGLLSDQENLRVEAKNLTAQRDRVRKELEVLLTQRGDYVQLASNGNADVIASAGMSIRNAPTPVGVLPAPMGLRLELTQVNGEVLVRWNTVAGARNYVLEYAEIISGEALAWAQASVCSKLACLVKDLTQGRRFAFRVASMGGADGQSAWSPVVERMVA